MIRSCSKGLPGDISLGTHSNLAFYLHFTVRRARDWEKRIPLQDLIANVS
jgi:hypothetical protein